MLKKVINYEDYNGNKVSEAFYFNLSKPELIEMEVEYPEGLATLIKNVIDAEDHKTLVKLMKDLILKSYGQKSADGKRFIKSDEIREEFSQTAAYAVLFMELAQNDNAAVVFIRGVLPNDMHVDIDQKGAEVTPIAVVPPT